jgi:hypothetical protein
MWHRNEDRAVSRFSLFLYYSALLCVMMEAQAFLRKSFFPHDSLPSRNGEEIVVVVVGVASHLSQQSHHNHVTHCCKVTFITLAPGVKSCHAHRNLTKAKIEVLSNAVSKG